MEIKIPGDLSTSYLLQAKGAGDGESVALRKMK